MAVVVLRTPEGREVRWDGQKLITDDPEIRLQAAKLVEWMQLLKAAAHPEAAPDIVAWQGRKLAEHMGWQVVESR
jgi:hypothetical protein